MIYNNRQHTQQQNNLNQVFGRLGSSAKHLISKNHNLNDCSNSYENYTNVDLTITQRNDPDLSHYHENDSSMSQDLVDPINIREEDTFDFFPSNNTKTANTMSNSPLNFVRSVSIGEPSSTLNQNRSNELSKSSDSDNESKDQQEHLSATKFSSERIQDRSNNNILISANNQRETIEKVDSFIQESVKQHMSANQSGIAKKIQIIRSLSPSTDKDNADTNRKGVSTMRKIIISNGNYISNSATKKRDRSCNSSPERSRSRSSSCQRSSSRKHRRFSISSSCNDDSEKRSRSRASSRRRRYNSRSPSFVPHYRRREGSYSSDSDDYYSSRRYFRSRSPSPWYRRRKSSSRESDCHFYRRRRYRSRSPSPWYRRRRSSSRESDYHFYRRRRYRTRSSLPAHRYSRSYSRTRRRYDYSSDEEEVPYSRYRDDHHVTRNKRNRSREKEDERTDNLPPSRAISGRLSAPNHKDLRSYPSLGSNNFTFHPDSETDLKNLRDHPPLGSSNFVSNGDFDRNPTKELWDYPPLGSTYRPNYSYASESNNQQTVQDQAEAPKSDDSKNVSTEPSTTALSLSPSNKVLGPTTVPGSSTSLVPNPKGTIISMTNAKENSISSSLSKNSMTGNVARTDINSLKIGKDQDLNSGSCSDGISTPIMNKATTSSVINNSKDDTRINPMALNSGTVGIGGHGINNDNIGAKRDHLSILGKKDSESKVQDSKKVQLFTRSNMAETASNTTGLVKFNIPRVRRVFTDQSPFQTATTTSGTTNAVNKNSSNNSVSCPMAIKKTRTEVEASLANSSMVSIESTFENTAGSTATLASPTSPILPTAPKSTSTSEFPKNTNETELNASRTDHSDNKGMPRRVFTDGLPPQENTNTATEVGNQKSSANTSQQPSTSSSTEYAAWTKEQEKSDNNGKEANELQRQVANDGRDHIAKDTTPPHPSTDNNIASSNISPIHNANCEQSNEAEEHVKLKEEPISDEDDCIIIENPYTIAGNGGNPSVNNNTSSSEIIRNSKIQNDNEATVTNSMQLAHLNTADKNNDMSTTIMKNNNNQPVLPLNQFQFGPTPSENDQLSTITTPVVVNNNERRKSRLPALWKVRMSDDGFISYYNIITGEESSTRPVV